MNNRIAGVTVSVPTYDGDPLSALTIMTTPDSGMQLWMYGKLLDVLPNDLDTINMLVAEGYQHVPQEPKQFYLSHLFTQMHTVLNVGRNQVWVKQDALAFVKQHQASLAVVLHQKSDEQYIPMLQFLPPPTLGEWGAVNVNGDLEFSHISQLPEAAQKVQGKLRKALLTLALPGQWVGHTEFHTRAASELQYNRLVTELRAQILSGTKQEREHIKKLLSAVEETHDQVTKLRQSWLKPDWLLKYKEIQCMAQELAVAYSDHYQQIPEASPFLFPDLEEKTQKKKKIARPTAKQIFNEQGYAPIVASLPMQAVIHSIHNATAGANRWVYDEIKNDRPPYFVYEKNAGTTIVSYSDQPDETVNIIPDSKIALRLWDGLKNIDPQAVDVTLDIFSHLSRNMQEDGSCWFFASSHLDNRGIQPIMKSDTPGGKKRKAGYRREDMQPINNTLYHLENLWLTIDQYIEEEKVNTKGKKIRKKIGYTHRGRFLMVSSK